MTIHHSKNEKPMVAPANTGPRWLHLHHSDFIAQDSCNRSNSCCSSIKTFANEQKLPETEPLTTMVKPHGAKLATSDLSQQAFSFDTMLGFFDSNGGFTVGISHRAGGAITFKLTIVFSQTSSNKDVLERVCLALNAPNQPLYYETYTTGQIIRLKFASNSSLGKYCREIWQGDYPLLKPTKFKNSLMFNLCSNANETSSKAAITAFLGKPMTITDEKKTYDVALVELRYTMMSSKSKTDPMTDCEAQWQKMSASQSQIANSKAITKQVSKVIADQLQAQIWKPYPAT